MKYQEFIDYIYQRHSGNVKLGLDRMHAILDAMNNPQSKLRGIHIAGTNGKGSTAAMCEAMSIAHEMKTGMNTSPHLVDYRERFRLNGKLIDFEELISIYKKWEHTFEENEASFFEITTALAFYCFLLHNIDTAIFEVGLGGRLDGTNPFNATVSVITNISYDHTKSLGATLSKIAYEKAGIIKPDVPVIIGKMHKNARDVIRKIAREKNAPLYSYENDFRINNVSVNHDGTYFDYYSPDLSFQGLKTNLLGSHQAMNAAMAITAFKLYMKRINHKIDAKQIRSALHNVHWPGRLQIINQNPLILVDGAHNEKGVKNLVANLKQIYPHKKVLFVMAILRDKNLKEIIKSICYISSKIYISKNQSTRAAEIEDQQRYVQKFGTEYEVIHDVVLATKKAISDASDADVIIISGSLYTISEVLKANTDIFDNDPLKKISNY
jgi:dihydrofolate synthase/folylpolyglutamate synthase